MLKFDNWKLIAVGGTWTFAEEIISTDTGTAKVAVSSDPPDEFVSADPENPDPGTIEDADQEYEAEVGTAPTEDVMILVDNEGNITYGYLAED